MQQNHIKPEDIYMKDYSNKAQLRKEIVARKREVDIGMLHFTLKTGILLFIK